MDPRVVLVSAFLTGATAASPAALMTTPGAYDVQGAYVAASTLAPCHPDPRDLAAIQSVESPSAVVDPAGHVSNSDGSPVRGDGGQSYGAFQFYTEAGTWSTYGAGGDPDNLGDAAAATAKMLCANNYASDRHAAIARHNGSGPAAQAYADRVIAAADASPPIAASASSSSSAADDGCQPTGKRSLGDVLNRAWCGLIVKPWDALRHKHPSPELDKVDKVVFGDGDESGSPTPASGQGARILSAARSWVGRDFNPGVPAQCALFVRQALGDAGVPAGVTAAPVDGYAPTGEGRANSFGPDMGQVIHDSAQLQPGDVVMFANTYGDFAKGDITHVAIYAGDGQIIDRGTYDSPVTLRPFDTFAGHFAAGVRLGTPTGGAT